MPKAFLFVWLQDGTKEALTDSQVWSFALVESRAGSRRRWPRAEGEEIAFEIPFGVWKAPGFLVKGGLWKPHSVLLGFGGVIFPLAGVPQQQGDADGREGHDPEGCPVQLWKTKALLRSLDD